MFFKGSQLNKSTLHGSSPLGKEGFSPPTYPRMTRSSVDARARRRASPVLSRAIDAR